MKTSLYLTYLGSAKSRSDLCHAGAVNIGVGKGSESTRLPILIDCGGVSESIEASHPFSTKMPGSGVVELSRYGVQPLPREGEYLLYCFGVVSSNPRDDETN
jgi:hypothetical protein